MAVLFEEIERFGLHPKDQAMVGRLDGFDGFDMCHGDDENVGLCCWFDIIECNHVLVLLDIKREVVDVFLVACREFDFRLGARLE